MSNPDIQYFAEDGTWVKPPGAVRVDIVLKGGDAGDVAPVRPGGPVPGGGFAGGSVSLTPDGAVMTGSGGGGGRGGATVADVGPKLSAYGWIGTSDSDGEIKAMFYPAGSLPDEMPVEVGRGGRPGGRDGYALIVTHLADERDTEREEILRKFAPPQPHRGGTGPPQFGNGRTEAEEKADDSRMIREGMHAAFPPLTYLDSRPGPAFPPQPERSATGTTRSHRTARG